MNNICTVVSDVSSSLSGYPVHRQKGSFIVQKIKDFVIKMSYFEY